MKQLLLLLTLFISLSVFGQKQNTVTFDFTSPSSLGLPTDDDTEVTDETFALGKVKMSFSAGAILGGVRYIKLNNAYFLRIGNSSRLILNATEGAVLTSVKFNFNTNGDFDIAKDQKGNWDDDNHLWTCSSNDNAQSVAFKVSGVPSIIKSVTVTYIEPTQILEPSVSESALQVSSLKDFTLTFASKMTKVGTQSLALTNGSKTYPLTVTINDATVVLSTTEAITTDGTYTLSIPAGYFQDANGYSNKALSYTIAVSTPKNTLNYISISPEAGEGGEIDMLNSPIKLTYNTYLKLSPKELMMQKDGVDFAKVNLEKSDYKEVSISFLNIPEVIEDKGIYTIKVPEGVIYDNLERYHNPDFTITYKVGYKPAPVYSEAMKTAIDLISKTGVGYPTAESDSRKALVALTTAEEVPSDEALQPAIEAFYKETNVEMPVEGKWYYISNINTENTPLYITAKNGVVGVTETKSEATAFEMCNPMAFKTKDGKYLYTAGLEENTDKKDLKMEKFLVSGTDAKKLLGCLSIYGYFETTKKGDVLNAFASVDHENKAIATDDHDTAPMFGETYSGAFMLAETVEPSDEPNTVDMNCTVSPSTVTDDTGKLTLTFTDSNVITIAENAEAELCTEEGEKIQNVSLLADKTKTDVAIVIAGNLQDGKYKLVIPAGSIGFVKEEKQYTNNELTVLFEVKKGAVNPPTPTPSEDFNDSYAGILYYPVASIIKDVDLNEFTIGNSHYNYPNKPQGLVVDETKTVILKQVDTVREIRRGHFERVSSIPTDPSCPDAYKIVFDSPIAEGELKADTYTFIIAPATFGDNNFGKYLADKTSIKASLCYVNSVIEFPYKVDNSQATSIKEITSDSSKEAVIYDLMGRRVQSMSRPGIYIVNGKKVVKK